MNGETLISYLEDARHAGGTVHLEGDQKRGEIQMLLGEDSDAFTLRRYG